MDNNLLAEYAVFVAIQPNGEMNEITELDLIISLHKELKKSLQ